MKLTLTYVVLIPGIGLPPESRLSAAMQSLKERVSSFESDSVDAIELRLVVDDLPRQNYILERDGRDLVVHCFVDFTKYKTLNITSKIELLRDEAENVVTKVLSDISYSLK